MSPAEIEELIERVRQGLASVRYAAVMLNWTVDEVCIAAFGRNRNVTGRPRLEDRANTIEARKPWIAEGICRRAWYNHRAKERAEKRVST